VASLHGNDARADGLFIQRSSGRLCSVALMKLVSGMSEIEGGNEEEKAKEWKGCTNACSHPHNGRIQHRREF
jgi:hypothetical protein